MSKPDHHLYVEVNSHTGERRLHTSSSLRARLSALFPTQRIFRYPRPDSAVETPHAWFRLYSPASMDVTPPPQALSTGGWGVLPVRVPCESCGGTGKLKVDLGVGVEKEISCWTCHGCGEVVSQ
jgi:hypothetical protein